MLSSCLPLNNLSFENKGLQFQTGSPDPFAVSSRSVSFPSMPRKVSLVEACYRPREYAAFLDCSSELLHTFGAQYASSYANKETGVKDSA